MKSVLWRVAKRLSCIEDAWCLKVKVTGYTAGVRTRYIRSHKSFLVVLVGISQDYCH